MTGTDDDRRKNRGAETAASMPAAGDANLLDIWGFIRRGKGFIALGLVLGLALSYFHYSRQTPIYQSEVEILVMQKNSNLPTQGVEGGSGLQQKSMNESLLSTHARLLQSPRVIKRAIEKYDLKSVPTIVELIQKGDDPTAYIAEHLAVTKGGSKETEGANVLSGTFEGPLPEDCATILRAVVGSYQDFLGETFQDTSEEAVELISQAKFELAEDVQKEEAAYQKFRAKAPLLSKNESGTKWLDQIETSLSEVRVKYTEAKARLHVIEEVLSGDAAKDFTDLDKLSLLGQKNVQRLSLLLEVKRGGPSQTYSPILTEAAQIEFNGRLDLLLQEQTLLTNFGTDHPEVRSVRQQIDLTKKFLEENGPSILSSRTLDVEADELLKAFVELLQHDLSELKIRQEELEGYASLEEGKAKKLAMSVLQDELMRSELTRKRNLHDAVVERLREINLIKDYGGYITEVISPVEQAQDPVSPVLIKTLALGGVLGLFCGTGLAYVVRLVDRTFHNPNELRQALALPIIGQVPALVIENGKAGKAAGGEIESPFVPTLVSYHRPRSRYAEAFRGLRTAIYFNAHVGKHKVIQITSPNPKDGKSTLAANLAISMAQSGKKVMLVDCDFRNSTVHKLFGLNNSVGASNVIAGDQELPDVIQSVDVENLSILPGGPHPSNPSELLTSPKFDELVTLLSERYDLIIIDSPPALAVSDPATIASRVDGVLLVLRITKDGRPEAVQAKQLLTSVGAQMLGVVVNGWHQASGYGYGYYGQGYGYGYGYGYGEKDSDYYQDEEAPATQLSSADSQ